MSLGMMLRWWVVVSWTDWDNPETRPQGPQHKQWTTTTSRSWIFVINPLMIMTIQTVILLWRLVYIESGENCVCLSEWVIERPGLGERSAFLSPSLLMITTLSHHHQTRLVSIPRHHIIIISENCQYNLSENIFNWQTDKLKEDTLKKQTNTIYTTTTQSFTGLAAADEVELGRLKE